MVQVIGKGTKLEYEKPATTWVEIPCLMDVTPPGIEYDQVDAEECLNSTGQTTAESAPGDAVPDEVAFTAALDPGSTEDADLQAFAAAGSVENWRITYSNGVIDTFPGYLRRYKGQAISRREYLRVEGIIIRTGDVTQTPAPP